MSLSPYWPIARELLRRQVRKMPHREWQVEEEGLPSRCLPLHEVDGLRHQFGVDLGANFPRVGLDGAQWPARDGLDDLRPFCQQFIGRLIARVRHYGRIDVCRRVQEMSGGIP